MRDRHAPERAAILRIICEEMNNTAIDADDVWDAGAMGCGELVIHLKFRLREMPGKVLRLIALDAGAPADIPAYCRMTGNRLEHTDPETCSYWIRAKTPTSN